MAVAAKLHLRFKRLKKQEKLLVSNTGGGVDQRR
jgi:hypothetical protein